MSAEVGGTLETDAVFGETGVGVDWSHLLRRFILLRLKHRVSEAALDEAATLFIAALHHLHNEAATESDGSGRGVKRSLDEAIAAVEQVSSLRRRRTYVARHFSPVVRRSRSLYCELYMRCFELG